MISECLQIQWLSYTENMPLSPHFEYRFWDHLIHCSSYSLANVVQNMLCPLYSFFSQECVVWFVFFFFSGVCVQTLICLFGKNLESDYSHPNICHFIGLPWTPKVRQKDIDSFLDNTRIKFVGFQLQGDRTSLAGLPQPIHEGVKVLSKASIVCMRWGVICWSFMVIMINALVFPSPEQVA